MAHLAMCRAPKQRLGASLCRFLDLEIWGRLTCDIWGLKLISFRSTDPGERLCNIWHRSTPSRSACAKSKTAAEGHTTRWFGGRTLQSINHRPHCLHSSMVRLRGSAPRKVSRVFGDRLIAAHRPGRLYLRRGVFFTLSPLAPQIIDLDLYIISTHYMHIPGACQLCCRHKMEMVKAWKTTKTIRPVQRLQRRREHKT